MTRKTQSSLRKKSRGRLLLPTAIALATVTSATLIAVAQEPRFRLRNIPQRIVNRIVPELNPSRKNPNADPSNPNKKPEKGDDQESDASQTPPEDVKQDETMESAKDPGTASLQLPSLTGAPTEGAALVVATEEEKHQKIADGWPEPWACLFITGRQHGYIEPCGCTGLENQKGGLNRRDTLLTQMKERGWTMVPVDAGDQVRRQGVQQDIKFGSTADAFKLMGYSAVGFGPEELKLATTDLLTHMTNIKGQFESQFVSSNTSIVIPEAPERYKVIKLPSGRTIGITSVLGDDFAQNVNSGEINIEKAVKGLTPVAKELQKQKCDYLVLLVNGSLQETERIAQAVPIFNVVVTAGGHGEPLYKPEPIPKTNSMMIQVGVKGMYVGLLGLYDDKDTPFRYQRIALSSQFEDSPRIMELFAKYQETLKKTGFKNLGLTPLTHPSRREFVGTEKCGECHTHAYEVWKNTPHAHATESLVHPPGRGNVPRQFDPECVSCHVTGWNPQEYYPYRSGFVSLQATAQMAGNGCENCHGPGSEHVAYESGEKGEDKELRAKLIEEMRLPLASAHDKCMECHDLDNSPEFHKDGAFEKYWKEVAHYGKD